MDVAILQNATGQFDIALDGADLKTEKGLRTAVILSLFTDAQAHDDDVLPDNTTNKRGYWGDTWPVMEGDAFGSRLWLLDRDKQTNEVLTRAREYAYEALQWLIEDGIASHISVVNEWISMGAMGIQITLKRGNDVLHSDMFNYEL